MLSLEPIPLQTPPGKNTRTGRRASLKRIIGHLTAVTNGAVSFPMALAAGIGGEGGWKGLELINGTRYSDLKQALEDFNTVYGPQQWRVTMRPTRRPSRQVRQTCSEDHVSGH